ncbi:HU family DNA-binding protein [Fusobacterium ulcerans]|uniref:HU family DNA-binding protein n=1 Tax=Fusobacterium ulcerans TaxID=861 RepID=UPI0010320E9E|nr:HU family DNA-binding protein [Fusobacterium ulcerans]
MREKDFLRLYVDLYREKGEKIASAKVAKQKIDSIWETLIESLLKEKKVIFKGIGKFELRETNPRRVVLPFKKKGESSYMLEKKMIPPKKIIKFAAGDNLKKLLNEKECES